MMWSGSWEATMRSKIFTRRKLSRVKLERWYPESNRKLVFVITHFWVHFTECCLSLIIHNKKEKKYYLWEVCEDGSWLFDGPPWLETFFLSCICWGRCGWGCDRCCGLTWTPASTTGDFLEMLGVDDRDPGISSIIIKINFITPNKFHIVN